MEIKCRKILRIKRFRNILRICKNLFQQFKDCSFSKDSSSIAFTSMFAIIPCFAVSYCVSKFLSDAIGFDLFKSNLREIFDTISSTFGIDDMKKNIIEYAQNYKRESGFGSFYIIITICTFAWTVTGVYSEIENFFNKMWETKETASSWLKKRFSFKAFMSVGILTLYLVAITYVSFKLNISKNAWLIISGVFLFCWMTLFLAFEFIPQHKPKGNVALITSLVTTSTIAGTLFFASSNIVHNIFSSYMKIYGSQLFFYLLIYYFIWVEILFGCRLTFEWEMGLSDFLGEKRINWKDMSNEQKEAICWHFYNKLNQNNKDNKIDPKIEVWALDKLKGLGFIEFQNGSYSKKESISDFQDFHDKFYRKGNRLPKKVESSIQYKQFQDDVEALFLIGVEGEIERIKEECEKKHSEKEKSLESELNDTKQELEEIQSFVCDRSKCFFRKH